MGKGRVNIGGNAAIKWNELAGAASKIGQPKWGKPNHAGCKRCKFWKMPQNPDGLKRAHELRPVATVTLRRQFEPSQRL
jgi:hypothetical protein